MAATDDRPDPTWLVDIGALSVIDVVAVAASYLVLRRRDPRRRR